SRGARTDRFTAADSRLRSDMAIVRQIIFADVGVFAQRRQAALRAFTLALQHGSEPPIIGGPMRTVDLRMPEMNDAGRKAPILAAWTAAQQSDQQIGARPAPTGERSVEPVDPLETGAPNGEIAGARAAPLSRSQLAQRTERQPQQRRQPIDAATQPLPDPARCAPRLRLCVVAQHHCREGLREQYAVAGDEPAGLCQLAMPRDEVR